MRLWSCATNKAKTRLVNFQHDSFRFFGCDFAWRRSLRTGNRCVHVEPSPKRGCTYGKPSVKNLITGRNTAVAPRQSDG